MKIPAPKVLDAATSEGTISGVTANLCSDRLHDRFEQQPLAWFWHQSTQFVPARRPIGTAGDRTILMDTNTSQADFIATRRTPAEVPHPR